MTQVKHTPLIVNEKTPCTIITQDGRRISVCWSSMDGSNDLEAEQFAAEIVKCVNSHDALMEALKDAQATFYRYYEMHMEKTPPDLVKAEANLRKSKMCELALVGASS